MWMWVSDSMVCTVQLAAYLLLYVAPIENAALNLFICGVDSSLCGPMTHDGICTHESRGMLTIVAPVPWAEMCKMIVVSDRAPAIFDPPVPLPLAPARVS